MYSHLCHVLMITDESLIAPHVQLYILKEKDQRICAPALKPPQVNTINNLVFSLLTFLNTFLKTFFHFINYFATLLLITP